jgi:hypothetical protein
VTTHFVVIGAQRCGTTSLHRLLEAHPQVAMARPARPEPKAFMSDDVLAEGLAGYERRWFAHATTELAWGEKSTSYLDRPDAIDRMVAVLGDPAIVVQLRDPVARAVSNWRFSTAGGLEDRPLDVALRENLSGPRSWDPALTSVSPYAYLERGRYAEALGPWVDRFGDRLHVQLLEDVLARPESLGALWRHLGVDPALGPAEAGATNRSEGPAPTLPDDLRDRLRDYYAAADTRLAELLGRPLPWTSVTGTPTGGTP